MAKASTTIDISALKVAGESNKYITMIDGSGIRIHEAGAVNTNFAQINSDGMQIYKGGTETDNKIAEFGAFTQIGKSNDIYLKIENSSLSLEDQGISNFQIFTEPVENGPIITLQLYKGGTVNGWNYFPINTTYKYSPRTYYIKFNTTVLDSEDNINFSYHAQGSVRYNNSSYTLSQNYTHSLTFGVSTSWTDTRRIQIGSSSYVNVTVIDGTYDGQNQITLKSRTNEGASTTSRSYVMVNQYSDATVTTVNKHLTSLSTVTIGNPALSYAQIDYHSLQLKDKEGNSYFYVSDLRDSNGSTELIVKYIGDGTTKSFNFLPPADNTDYTVTVSDDSGGTIDSKGDTGIVFSTAPSDNAIITITYTTSHVIAKAYTFGLRKTDSQLGALSVSEGYFTEASGPMSHSEGRTTEAKGFQSHAEGYGSIASGSSSHAEGNGTKATKLASHAEGRSTVASGADSHAEGGSTTASGANSHAEGFSTTASGDTSHAEGFSTTASGNFSHAEGSGTTASAHTSHAEGRWTIASGDYSHSQNWGTTAQRRAQTAIGEYNTVDTGGSNTTTRGTYAFIIGNGTGENARSNALVVDWNGGIQMYLDSNGTSSANATSGTDKDLFNAIRGLGWYSSVIA